MKAKPHDSGKSLDDVAHFLFVPLVLSATNIFWLIQIGRILALPRIDIDQAAGLVLIFCILAALLTSSVALAHFVWTRRSRSKVSPKLRVAYLCTAAPGLTGGVIAILMSLIF
jgi:hypothetical protein